jgi:DNA-binding transcriptional ArsR family regulator
MIDPLHFPRHCRDRPYPPCADDVSSDAVAFRFAKADNASMADLPNMAALAALIADPVRAAILCALMDGGARSSSDLAVLSGASPQAASNHLSKLLDGRLVKVGPSGRQRLYTLRGPAIAHVLESLLVASGGPEAGGRRIDPEIRRARRCYDHLAGAAGVAILKALVAGKYLAADLDGYRITRKGRSWFEKAGVDIAGAENSRRSFARPCMDWTERRSHLAGSLGAGLLTALTARNCLRASDIPRALAITPKGREFLRESLGLADINEWT